MKVILYSLLSDQMFFSTYASEGIVSLLAADQDSANNCNSQILVHGGEGILGGSILVGREPVGLGLGCGWV